MMVLYLVSFPVSLLVSQLQLRDHVNEILKVFDIGLSGACRESREVYLKGSKDFIPMNSMRGKLRFNKRRTSCI
jgi:hypothetical protein